MISDYTHSDVASKHSTAALSAYEAAMAKAVLRTRALERERAKGKMANDMGPLRFLFAIAS